MAFGYVFKLFRSFYLVVFMPFWKRGYVNKLHVSGRIGEYLNQSLFHTPCPSRLIVEESPLQISSSDYVQYEHLLKALPSSIIGALDLNAGAAYMYTERAAALLNRHNILPVN